MSSSSEEVQSAANEAASDSGHRICFLAWFGRLFSTEGLGTGVECTGSCNCQMVKMATKPLLIVDFGVFILVS